LCGKSISIERIDAVIPLIRVSSASLVLLAGAAKVVKK
jgi:hypothetical protein